jgi:7-keto-8-aminopelargonate synthetase-like enzyme
LEISEFQSAVGALHGDATRRGLFFQTADDTPLQGRRVCIGGREVVSFSSCSYLGLEFHPALIEGVQRAAARYGTQFSTSRGYLSAAPYRELEARLSRLFGGHALVTSTTSVGHQVALGALLTEQDAVVLDHQVHFSVQAAAQLARTQGATVEVVRHNHLERAVEVVRRLAATRSTVWFATDGVFSMYGDLAPLGLLRELLDVAPNVRLYVDDAHGMSWAGLHGRGSFLSRMPLHPRMVLATSLNKAFAAGGGCLVFPAAEERERVLLGGGPMVFSGPLQPPMLGAALASAALHLSPEIEARQAALRERTRLCNQLVRAHGLPLLVENESPIFFIPMGLPRIAMAVAERMLEDGFYVNVSAWPSVPMKRSGLRFSVTALHELDDIRAAFDAFARHVPAVLDQEQVSRHELDALFARAVPREALRGGPGAAGVPGVSLRRAHQPAVHLERFESIHEVDRALWDQAMGGVGACSWEAMALQEAVFSRGPREYRWAFRYLVVRDVGGDVVAVTFYTVALNKDDMLMRAAVSQAVEERRAADPYFLTSEVVMMGSGLSEGNHLALDRSGPWQEAVLCILEEMGRHYDRADAAALLLRDLPGDDPEMDALMARCGLVKVPMFASHNLALGWGDDEAWLAGLSRRKRRFVRDIMDRSRAFSARVYGQPVGPTLEGPALDHLYRLYRNVADSKRRLNVFPLPRWLLDEVQRSPAWELVTLSIDPARGGPADGRPVAFYGAHRHAGLYAPFFCGLDYRYIHSHGNYRCMLYQMVRRARALGMEALHLGMDAETEKSRFGAQSVPNCIYVQARDHDNAGVLREIVAEVGVAGRRSG